MAVDELPSFRFHPDPVATGAVRSSDSSCRCCGQARGFVVGHVYAEEALDEAVCPWCVANGTAAREFGATFVQYLEGGVSASDADEVLNRTPGYESWQGEYWLVHCRVPMVYYGDLAKDELRSLASDIRDRFVSENEYLFEDEPWPAVVRRYEPGGQMGRTSSPARLAGPSASAVTSLRRGVRNGLSMPPPVPPDATERSPPAADLTCRSR